MSDEKELIENTEEMSCGCGEDGSCCGGESEGCGGGCGGCGGGCGGGAPMVRLQMDDNTIVVCRVMGIFPVENGNTYIALLPMDGPDAEKGGVYLYRYVLHENGESNLELITSKEEFDLVASTLQSMQEGN